jgi:hypothetical protein
LLHHHSGILLLLGLQLGFLSSHWLTLLAELLDLLARHTMLRLSLGSRMSRLLSRL